MTVMQQLVRSVSLRIRCSRVVKGSIDLRMRCSRVGKRGPAGSRKSLRVGRGILEFDDVYLGQTGPNRGGRKWGHGSLGCNL